MPLIPPDDILPGDAPGDGWLALAIAKDDKARRRLQVDIAHMTTAEWDAHVARIVAQVEAERTEIEKRYDAHQRAA